MYVYASIGFKQIISEEEEEDNQLLIHQTANFHPDDKIAKNKKKMEIMCVSFSQCNDND